jgi:hypothetical protein
MAAYITARRPIPARYSNPCFTRIKAARVVGSHVADRDERRQGRAEQPRIRSPLRDAAVWGDDYPDVPRSHLGLGQHTLAEAAGDDDLVSSFCSDRWPTLMGCCSIIETVHTVTLSCLISWLYPNASPGSVVDIHPLPHDHGVWFPRRHPRGPLVLRSFVHDVCTLTGANSRAFRLGSVCILL